MVMCFVPDCNHYSEQGRCKFLTFPANIHERKKWIALIRRHDREPSKWSLVCSCHFVDKNRKNGPTLFEFNRSRRFNFRSSGKRKRKASGKDNKEESQDSIPKEKTTAMNIDEVATIVNEEATNIDEGATNIDEVATNIDETATNIDDTATNVDVSMPSTSKSLNNPSSVTLEVENYFLKQEVEELKMKLKNMKSGFSYEHIKDNDSLILMYTGISTNALFLTVIEKMESFNVKYYTNWIVESMPKTDQILMTLMKLRLNLPDEDLALRFDCNADTVTNIVMTWIHALHEVFFNQLMQTIHLRKKKQSCLPVQNSSIILNCTKIYSAASNSIGNQKLNCNSYKNRNTWKILVGVATNGVISFVSKAYPGSTSDVKIIENCGILKQMVSGDLILADKGSLIKDSLPKGPSLNIPPFLSSQQLTEPKLHDTQQIVKARIHVERAIFRIKCYHILLLVPHHYISQISIIFQLCAALANFQYPLIKEVEEE